MPWPCPENSHPDPRGRPSPCAAAPQRQLRPFLAAGALGIEGIHRTLGMALGCRESPLSGFLQPWGLPGRTDVTIPGAKRSGIYKQGSLGTRTNALQQGLAAQRLTNDTREDSGQWHRGANPQRGPALGKIRPARHRG